MKVPEIKKAISGLSVSEVQELVDYGLYLLSTKSKGYNREEELLFDSFAGLLKKEGISLPPYNKFKALGSYQRLKEASKTVNDFVAMNFGTLTVAQRMKFNHLVVTQLIEYVRRLPEVPVAFNTISNHVDKIGGLLDEAFPGYLQSKIFKKILLEKP